MYRCDWTYVRIKKMKREWDKKRDLAPNPYPKTQTLFALMQIGN